jgi:hypothetical protein
MITMHRICCRRTTKLIYSYVLEILSGNFVLEVVLIQLMPSLIPITFLIICGQNGNQNGPFKLEYNMKMQSTNQECKAIDKTMVGNSEL